MGEHRHSRSERINRVQAAVGGDLENCAIALPRPQSCPVEFPVGAWTARLQD